MCVFGKDGITCEESEEVFHKAGGEKLRAGPYLNDHTKWIDAMEQILREEGAGWI